MQSIYKQWINTEKRKMQKSYYKIYKIRLKHFKGLNNTVMNIMKFDKITMRQNI